MRQNISVIQKQWFYIYTIFSGLKLFSFCVQDVVIYIFFVISEFFFNLSSESIGLLGELQCDNECQKSALYKSR